MKIEEKGAAVGEAGGGADAGLGAESGVEEGFDFFEAGADIGGDDEEPLSGDSDGPGRLGMFWLRIGLR